MQTEQIQSVVNLLKQIETSHTPSAFACSFGLEDMVLLDLIAKHAPRIEVFTLIVRFQQGADDTAHS